MTKNWMNWNFVIIHVNVLLLEIHIKKLSLYIYKIEEYIYDSKSDCAIFVRICDQFLTPKCLLLIQTYTNCISKVYSSLYNELFF